MVDTYVLWSIKVVVIKNTSMCDSEIKDEGECIALLKGKLSCLSVHNRLFV